MSVNVTRLPFTIPLDGTGAGSYSSQLHPTRWFSGVLRITSGTSSTTTWQVALGGSVVASGTGPSPDLPVQTAPGEVVKLTVTGGVVNATVAGALRGVLGDTLADLAGYAPSTLAGNVSISGTPAVSISGTPAVTVSGTPTVAISGTPAVTVSGTPTVAISGTPAVTVNSGTVSVQTAAGVALAAQPSVPGLKVASTASTSYTPGQKRAVVTAAGGQTVTVYTVRVIVLAQAIMGTGDLRAQSSTTNVVVGLYSSETLAPQQDTLNGYALPTGEGLDFFNNLATGIRAVVVASYTQA